LGIEPADKYTFFNGRGHKNLKYRYRSPVKAIIVYAGMRKEFWILKKTAYIGNK
jgi:hypothetical protein